MELKVVLKLLLVLLSFRLNCTFMELKVRLHKFVLKAVRS